MVDRWYDEMGAKGHLKDGSTINGSFRVGYLCDPDSGGPSCRDHWRPDEADAWILGTHGTDSGDHWASLMRLRASDGPVLDRRRGAAVAKCGWAMSTPSF